MYPFLNNDYTTTISGYIFYRSKILSKKPILTQIVNLNEMK